MSAGDGERRGRGWRWLPVLAPAVGMVWGLLCWWGDGLESGAGVAFNAGGPWLLIAFLLGALGRNVLAGGLFGALALGLGVIAYFTAYDIALLIGPDAPVRYFIPGGAAWLVVALATGTLFGAAGALARSRRHRLRVAGAALVGGALLGEGLLILTDQLVERYLDTGPLIFLSLEALLGLALPLLVPRDRRDARRAIIVTVVLAAVGLLVQVALLDFLATRYRA